MLAAVIALVFHAAMYGPQASFIAEMFPAQVRYSGASMGYQLAGVVGGALAPIVATALLSSFHSSVAVSVYTGAVLLLTVACVAIAKETAKVDIDAVDAPVAHAPADATQTA